MQTHRDLYVYEFSKTHPAPRSNIPEPRVDSFFILFLFFIFLIAIFPLAELMLLRVKMLRQIHKQIVQSNNKTLFKSLNSTKTHRPNLFLS